MVERLIIALLIAALGILTWYAYNRWSLRRITAQAAIDPLLAGLQPGIPTIVYFTTPFCAPCRTVQKPTLTQLQAELGAAIQIVQIDATEDPASADRWGVFSAPTTFVLDANHQPRYINRGVASAETLKHQLHGT